MSCSIQFVYSVDNFCLNKYDFDNINNYSIVSILEYGDQKIIIPGDIETDGWEMLLKGDNFREAIKGTTVFIASHHGRESGFPDKIFNYFTPEVIIISDCEGIETSAVNKYRNYCKGSKIIKDKEKIDRFVLSTRNDGPIVIKIEGDPFYTPMSRNIYI